MIHGVFVSSQSAKNKGGQCSVRVGAFFSNSAPTSGGEYAFQNVVYSALKHVETRHRFYFFFNKLDAQAVRELVDVIWFVSPFHELIDDVPFVTTLWDLQHRLQPYFPEVSAYGNWQRREQLHSTLLNRASYVIAGTEVGKQEIMRFYHVPEERVRVLPFPAPRRQPRLPAVEGKDEEVLKAIGVTKPFLFYPAQFWAHKNHIRILQAVKRLQSEHGVNFSVVFTGSDKGNAAYIHQQTIDLQMQEQVFFLGFVKQEILDCLYRSAFALVFPTFFGPDNLPPLEAFSWGCPVIASSVAGADEQLKDAAMLFDPRSERELTNALCRLYGDQMLRMRLIESGYRRAEEIGTADDYVNKMMEIFDEFEPIRQCWGN